MVPDPNLDPEPVTPTTDGAAASQPRMWREVSLDSGEISVVPPNPAGIDEPKDVSD